MDFVESVQAFVEPLSKLVDHTANAIGIIYEPRRIVKKAEADAKKIHMLSEAMANSNVPVVIDGDNIALDSSNFDELCKRTGNRLAFQELHKQRNIEAVLDAAYTELVDEPPVTAEPIDSGWMSRFFDSAGEIGNEDMQILWAKVLAGEVKQPGTFSLRTMNVLLNLSKKDALLLEHISQYINYSNTYNAYLYDNNGLLLKYGIKLSEILRLVECGLISTPTKLVSKISIEPNESADVFQTCKYICFARQTALDYTLSLPSYALTVAGYELLRIIDKPKDDCFSLDIFRSIIADKLYTRNVEITLHKILSISDNNIEYDDHPLNIEDVTQDNVASV